MNEISMDVHQMFMADFHGDFHRDFHGDSMVFFMGEKIGNSWGWGIQWGSK